MVDPKKSYRQVISFMIYLKPIFRMLFLTKEGWFLIKLLSGTVITFLFACIFYTPYEIKRKIFDKWKLNNISKE